LKMLKKLRMPKRIKINTSFEDDEIERRDFFINLSYSDRLRYYFKLRNMVNFDKQPLEKGRIFKIFHSYDAI
jgi:hypothetical protein